MQSYIWTRSFSQLLSVLLCSLHCICLSTAIAADADPTTTLKLDEKLTKFASFEESSGASNSQQNVRTDTALIKYDRALVEYENPRIVQLKQGEIIVSASKETFIKTLDSTIELKPGALALISFEKALTKVRNLRETYGQVRQIVRSQYREFGPTEESILGADAKYVHDSLNDDSIARRNVRELKEPPMVTDVFSLATLMEPENSQCLHDLISSHNPKDQALSELLMKEAKNQAEGPYGKVFLRAKDIKH